MPSPSGNEIIGLGVRAQRTEPERRGFWTQVGPKLFSIRSQDRFRHAGDDVTNHDADAELLTKINKAVAEANHAEKTVTMAQEELVSRSRTVGLLLLEAKKLHPRVKEFEAFLARVDGLNSHAYDLMRLAGGRTTEEEIRKDTRDRVKKHRASKKKLPTPAPNKPEPKPDPISVTGIDVT